MSAAPHVPLDVVRAQITASDPAVSAWVSANAGSGKTHVLVQRVIRLLLDGVDPGKILCLTFTKAAAANMANRVFETLASWVTLDDAELDKQLLGLEGRPPNAARRTRARRLFAEALETPGGLKVQTIHAFCTALLHQLPFEADVAASFDVLEERAESELIDRLLTAVLLDAAGAPDTPLGRALAIAIATAADTTFRLVVGEAMSKRRLVEGWIARTGSVEAALDELTRMLGIEPGDTLAKVEAEFVQGPFLPRGEWPAVMRALRTGRDSDRKSARRLEHALAGTDWVHIENYVEIFCRADDHGPRRSVVTNTVKRDYPDLYARLMQEQLRVCALLERRKALLARDRTGALVTIADAVLRRYRAEKERRGVLDYDDLIEKTLALFDNSAAAWVHYKLDLGVDHVLIDEAQDTSPQQWEVIEKLTAEFFAGAGARAHVRRSIFAVGDEKQSIYSFQGAAPHRFDEMRRHFESAHADGGLAFEAVPLRTSFRSSPDILGAVDTVFGRPEAFEGLTTDPVATAHEAVRRNAPGSVDIWPLFEPQAKPDLDAWDAPLDAVSEQSPQVRLARAIAESVRLWIARGERVGDNRRPVTPGDVLILVRQRGALFEAIIRALKDVHVDVAGADRLVLTEHIAVMDLMSLADALLLPEDDLALAEVLKSPLFGLNDESLFALAYGRKGSLRAALRAKAADLEFAEAAASLDRLEALARAQTPFAFYAGLLGAGGGRRRMLARLGMEAADALDEFLALALDYESRHTPSLQGFVAWLRASEAEVKRDMDIVRNEVRVMTVHGAKGLEAPIVVLADTVTPPAGPRDPPLFTLGAAGLPPDAPAPIVWGKARATDVPPVADARAVAREAAENEHRRLLYVAMTRAADRLVVCGARGQRTAPEGCWYKLVDSALNPDSAEIAADHGEGSIRRWQKSQPGAAEPAPPAAEPAKPVAPAPNWLTRQAPPEPPAARRMQPSDAAEGEPPAAFYLRGKRAETAKRARARGVHVHRLLQSLPAVPADRRAEAARRYFANGDKDLEPEDAERVTAQVLSILAHEAFAPLFAEGTRAETPVVGRIKCADGADIFVSGQIDRLAVTPDSVLIADYKTDRAPPVRAEDVPAAYRNQLALYRLLIGRLYPRHTVRAALVFTESAQLIELPAPMLDAGLASLGVAAA